MTSMISEGTMCSFLSYFMLIVTVLTIYSEPSEPFSVSSSSVKRNSHQHIYHALGSYGHHHGQRRKCSTSSFSMLVLNVSKLHEPESSFTSDDDDKYDDDDEDTKLLRQTKKSDLVSLCHQFELSSMGTKEELLKRLRTYAEMKIDEEHRRLEDRKKRIENGGGQDHREKYEIIDSDGEMGDDGGDDDDEVFVYFETKSVIPHFDDGSKKVDGNKIQKKNDLFDQQQNGNRPITPDRLTAPPPPPGIKPDENGERVVTVYSTTNQNDLTGVAAAQPEQAAARDPMTGPVVEPENTPWDFENKQKGSNGYQKSEASSAELDAAKEEVIELVQSLLAMTGAPGFVHSDDSEDNALSPVGIFRKQKPSSSFAAPEGFVGFDPTKVSTEILNKASKSIRMGRGSVLSDVTREFELRAVGYDGSFGDDEERGGGHYRQVSLVRSFLEGFRRAEVRRLARETCTFLLDKLVQDGIEGLDQTLSIMTRAGDDVNQEAGELNDSLLDYLNDAIRQMERKVEQKVETIERSVDNFDEDQLENLWVVGEEDGDNIETFDPKDPRSKTALQDEYEKDYKEQSSQLKRANLPNSAQERLLLLLKLLRERVKIEAAFPHDEKSQNLRVLAYCMNIKSEKLRKELITKEFGSSLDRLDSFSELVSSSIEYGESTAHQVQPNKVVTLNIPLLERILVNTKEIIEQQSWKASTGKS